MIGHGGAAVAAGTKRGALSIIAACLALVVFSPHGVNEAAAVTCQQDEAIDRAAGILGRPWKHAVAGMITGDYLRSQSRIRTGLPSYDQQPYDALNPPESVAQPPTEFKPEPAPEPAPTTEPTPAPESPPVILKTRPAH